MLNLTNRTEFKEAWVAKSIGHLEDVIDYRQYIVDIASITKGKMGYDGDFFNKPKLFDKLLIESNGQASTVFEFYPYIHVISTEYLEEEDLNKFRHGFLSEPDNKQMLFYTNERVMLKQFPEIIGDDYEVNTEVEYSDFKVIVAYLPYFIWMHLRTHRMLSFLIETARKPNMVDEFFTTDDLRYKDKPEMLRMRLGAIAGWNLDKEGWDNLYVVRSSKNTQKDTKRIVEIIKNLNVD